MNIFAEAARRVPGHWIKGMYHDDNGNACAVGHLSDVWVGEVIDWAATNDLVDSLVLEFTNGKYSSLPRFNDAPETTEEDVVAFLEKAAIKWDERFGHESI